MSSDPQQQAAAAAASTTTAGPSILDQVIKATRPQDQAEADRVIGEHTSIVRMKLRPKRENTQETRSTTPFSQARTAVSPSSLVAP